MNRMLLAFAAIVVLPTSALIAVTAMSRSGSTFSFGDVLSTSHADAVIVRYVTSSTKQGWVDALIDRFHSMDPETASGQPIRVHAEHVLSGRSMEDILDARLQPVVWSPGSEAWVDRFRSLWRQTRGSDPIKDSCRPTIYSPLGLAIWRPMAEALGWPGRPIGWKAILELANNPSGWASLGHAEWGRLKLGHPHPQYSNAGMLFLASVIHSFSGKTDDLDTDDVYADNIHEALSAFARNTTRYGMTSTDLLDQMARQGPNFLHVVSAFEEGVVRLNQERANELRFPMVWIAPEEGTFWSSHPFCIFDQASWTDDEQSEAAEIFYAFLLDAAQQDLAIDYRLRPLDDAVALRPPLDHDHGADPDATIETIAPLSSPSEAVAAAMVDQFLMTKRKASVLILFDASESMAGEKIRSATEATASFIGRLHPADTVAGVSFNDRLVELSTLTTVADGGEALAGSMKKLIADGGTALTDAVCRGMEIMLAQQAADQAHGEAKLYGIVLLSDGQNTSANPSLNQMFNDCLPSHSEADGVKVNVISFGENADTDVLARIAHVTGGKMFEADEQSIEDVYLSVSAD